MTERSGGQMRRKRQPIDGFLLLNKPSGMSSNHALQRMRGLLNAAKAGHAGTLDPLASGLLPLALGEATKFCGFLLEADKSYTARIQLGQTTDTADAEGRILEQRPVDVGTEQIERVVRGFMGESEQMPPMYSALKHQGKPLYAYARAGQEVERRTRLIRIEHIEADQFDTQQNCFTLRVRCSKGTYIRTLAEDIGQRLGCGAHLIGLCRDAIGPLTLEQAYGFEQFEALTAAQRMRSLYAVDMPLQHLPALELDKQQANILRQGQSLATDATMAEYAVGSYRLYDNTCFFGLGEIRADDRRIYSQRLLAQDKIAIQPEKSLERSF